METNTNDTLTVQAGADVVTAIERFTVDDSAEADDELDDQPLQTVTTLPSTDGDSPLTPELDRAVRYTMTTLRNTPGFVAAAVLNGQHGELAVYSQWRVTDTAKTAIDAAWSVAPALAGTRAKLLAARTFSVDFTAPGETTQFAMTTTPHAHFGLFKMDPSDQERLLELARADAPKSLGTPGLLAINFHRSLDGQEVVNFGAWKDFDGFAELLTRPGFMEGAPYWDGVASFRNIFFDVAAVVSAP